MKITAQYRNDPGYQVLPAGRVRPGEETQPHEYPVLEEHLLEVYLNDILTFKLVCSPIGLEDMVLGRLLTEGIIRSADEIELLYICDQGLRARVFFRKGFEPAPAEKAETVDTVNSCCTGNRTVSHAFSGRRLPEPLQPIPWEPEWAYAMAQAMRDGMPLHMQTHSAHCAMLMRGGEILTHCEDIGRHNALDKAIGWAVRNGIPLQECVLYTSGRVPLDMTSKVIRAGVPVLVSKAMPTRQSVELAAEYGLTLICGTFPDEMKIFNAPG